MRKNRKNDMQKNRSEMPEEKKSDFMREDEEKGNKTMSRENKKPKEMK